MNQSRLRVIRWAGRLVAFGLAFLAGSAAYAQQAPWLPNKPVRFVVGFPPGTPGDIITRAMAPHLHEVLKQPVVVENRPGAGGVVGAQSVLGMDTDGHTVLVGPDTILTVNPYLYRKVGYGPDTLRPLMTVGSLGMVLTCHPSTGVKTIDALIALAKSKSLNYSSGGYGVPGHLAMEMFLQATGIRMNHISYKGPAPAAVALLSGEVDCGFLSTNQVAPHLASGALTGLAISGDARSPMVPDQPTFAEIGLPSFDPTFAEVLYTVAGVPESARATLRAAVLKSMEAPAVKEAMRLQDVQPVGDTSEESARRIEKESARWSEMITRLGLKVE